MNEEILNEFSHPTARYRGKPFWAWNGKLNKDELIRQIHVMKEMGLGGFFMHSRTGLQTEYLGEEWFELIDACIDEAERLGMEAWLYDEDRWPSGIAGGMVTKDPQYRMKSIKLWMVPDSSYCWSPDVVAAFSCNMEGADIYDCCRLYEDTPKEKYQGKTILVFTIVEMSKDTFFNGYTYLDVLNREATNRFLELTHEKYKSNCGDRFKSVKGIFTDEPYRGTLMEVFGQGNDKDVYRAPWTDTLFEEFKERFGYDLTDHLPELFLRMEGKTVSQVKWHYVELLQQMFIENYAKPIDQWCRDNDLILTGHILHEDCLSAQTALSGSVMRYYEHMEYPGVDVLGEYNTCYWTVKQLASAGRQLGRKWLLSELYGVTGWQMDFEGHKAVGDWQALFGINLRCHHLSWYTMEGEAKRDCPGSILHQSTWWQEYKHVEDYFSRIGVVMSQGTPCCDVLVVNPVESVWCQVYSGWAEMFMPHEEAVKQLEERYRNVFHWLAGSHIDFDYGDEEMMSRLYSIEKDTEGVPVLKVGQASYRVVIVAGLTTIRTTTLKILDEFQEAGGKIIFSGLPPQYVDALSSKEAACIAEKVTTTEFERNTFVNACKNATKYKIDIIDKSTGDNMSQIYCQIRQDGDSIYMMALNMDRNKGYDNVIIRLHGRGYIVEYNCTDGNRTYIGESLENGIIEIRTDFPPAGEHVYEITKELPEGIHGNIDLVEEESIELEGPYDFELDELNICLLDRISWRLNNDSWHKEGEILREDRKIRRKLGMPMRHSYMLQPWFANKTSYDVNEELELEFQFYIDDIPEEHVYLALEKPEIYVISINGHVLDTSKVEKWWVDKCFSKLMIPIDFLAEGKNIISMKTIFNEGVNLEAMYLLGKFGVELDGTKKTLVELPNRLMAKDTTTQKLPFYTGKIRYRLPVNRKLERGEKAFLKVDAYEGACIKVASSCGESKIVGWQPYEVDITDFLVDSNEVWLEVVLTRKNVFGPLYCQQAMSEADEKEILITREDCFANQYQLIQSGLLFQPRLLIKADYSE